MTGVQTCALPISPATVENVLLQQGEERFHGRVIARCADSSHRPDDAVTGQSPSEFLRPVHVGAVPEVVRGKQCHPVDGRGRGVLGQRGRGELLLAFEDGVLSSSQLRNAAGGQDRGDGLHRVLVQPTAPECQGRSSCPGAGLERLPREWPDRPGGVREIINELSQKLDERSRPMQSSR